MQQIHIEPGNTPTCVCGSRAWRVEQRITRSSDLTRVDGFGDLVIAKPDLDTYTQAVTLLCAKCKDRRDPRQGITAAEAYYENGGEDGYGWPQEVNHHGDED